MIPTQRWRWAFAAYVLLIALLTHWPGVKINAPIPRPDLLVHVGVFSLWTLLCARSQVVGRWGRWSAIWASTALSAGYAGLDEWTQQFFNRQSAWDDMLANLLGVSLGTGAIILWTQKTRSRARSDNHHNPHEPTPKDCA